MTKLVYIGGYGHSGTTLLEYMLSASPLVLSCGEVVTHLKQNQDKICSCGNSIAQCPVWYPFYPNSDHLRMLSHVDLTVALLNNAKGYSAVVDSSKTAWSSFLAPFRMHRVLGHDLLLVHVVRDPRAVCWSTMRKLRGLARAIRCLRTVLGWIYANLSCELFGKIRPTRYVRVSYEDLAN